MPYYKKYRYCPHCNKQTYFTEIKLVSDVKLKQEYCPDNGDLINNKLTVSYKDFISCGQCRTMLNATLDKDD